MGLFRARDLLLVPNLLSLARVPLAAAFVLFADRSGLALAVLALSGLTDVLDGWYARRFQQATATGAVVDGLTDKVFAATVVVTLVARKALEWEESLLLFARELGEAPLVAWWALSRPRRRAKAESPRANYLGKAVTALQFVAVALVLFGDERHRLVALAAAVLGVLAAIAYWRRELG